MNFCIGQLFSDVIWKGKCLHEIRRLGATAVNNNTWLDR